MAKTYAEKLKDPKWQKKRLEVLERDKFKCQWCSSAEKTLHVHHLTYGKGKMPWDYPNENFVSLCEECHEEAEAGKQKILSCLGSRYRMTSLLAICKTMSSGASHLDNVISDLVHIIGLEKDFDSGNYEDPHDQALEIKDGIHEAVENLFRCGFSIDEKVRMMP